MNDYEDAMIDDQAAACNDQRIMARWIRYVPEYADMPGEADWDKAEYSEEGPFDTIEKATAYSAKKAKAAGFVDVAQVFIEEFQEYPNYPGYGEWNRIELWIDGELHRSYEGEQ